MTTPARTLLLPQGQLFFLSEIATLRWRGRQRGDTFAVKIYIGGQPVLSAVLHTAPDSDEVAVADVDKLLSPALRIYALQNEARRHAAPIGENAPTEQRTFPRVDIETENGGQRTFFLLPSMRVTQLSAEAYLQKYPLTLHRGVKTTFHGAEEHLSIGFSNFARETSCHLSMLWEYEGEMMRTEEWRRKPLPKYPYSYETYTFNSHDFSPPHPLARLVSYTAIVKTPAKKDIVQTYEVSAVIDAPPTTFRFVNNFGTVDTFHAFGETIQEHKTKRTIADLRTGRQLLDIEEHSEFEVDTGSITPHSWNAFSDLLHAAHVWVNGEAVVITDSPAKMGDSPFHQNSAVVKYERAARQPTPLLLEKQVFDHTFDATFD